MTTHTPSLPHLVNAHCMSVEVVAASSHPQTDGKPIITIHARYPRFIHSEIMTHRVFSRNARSSRAVPVARMIEEVINTPVVPWYWGKNQPGMQAHEECFNEVVMPVEWSKEGIKVDEDNSVAREKAWRIAASFAAETAREFALAGYHKQIANRLLEPFMWIDTLITATEWDNFFELRCHPDAEPHFEELAGMMRRAIEDTRPTELKIGEWHRPYVTLDEEAYWSADAAHTKRETGVEPIKLLNALSAARCARISYKPFDGRGDVQSELKRFELLAGSTPLHASPIEHQAMATLTGDKKFNGNFCSGWAQGRKLYEDELFFGSSNNSRIASAQ